MDEKAEKAMIKAWYEHYGNIHPDIIPPLHPFFKEAFKAGVDFARMEQETQPCCTSSQ